MDEELETLRKQALAAIQALPEDKQAQIMQIIAELEQEAG